MLGGKKLRMMAVALMSAFRVREALVVVFAVESKVEPFSKEKLAFSREKQVTIHKEFQYAWCKLEVLLALDICGGITFWVCLTLATRSPSRLRKASLELLRIM